MLGLPSGQVLVVTYDPSWPAAFETEKNRILEACSRFSIAIEHVGSTAVPGLSAKPILDIMIGIPNDQDGVKLVPFLEELGYFYKGENGIPGRHYFTLGNPRTHHIHMVKQQGEIWKKHLLFRDYLRIHKKDRDEYAALKQVLSGRFPTDRLRYTESKNGLIQHILEKARKASEKSGRHE